MRGLGTALACLALAACERAEAPAQAQHDGHPMNMATAAQPTPAQAAYQAAAERMHGAMAAPVADPDEAFVRGMIPHHQGAIDMARVQLRYGRDPELRRLTEQIIAAQEREIGEMRAWLARREAARP